MTRKFQTLPNIDDIAGYAEEWQVWWHSIQPKWRQSWRDGLVPLLLSTAGKKDDTVFLRKGGPSGLVTILIGLKWWASIHGQDARWLALVEDIRGCMENLVVPEKKKKGGDDIAQEKKRKEGKLEGSAKRRKA